jgi:hypothetical protein
MNRAGPKSFGRRAFAVLIAPATRSVSLYVDGNEAVATDTSTSAPRALGSTMYVGAAQYDGIAGNFLLGEIAEIVIYDCILTDGEQARLFVYLRRKRDL